MTVKDLLPMEIDIDVYDDVCEDLGIAFCGPCVLTDAGREEFKEVMDYEITLVPHSYGGCPAYIVHVDDADDRVWKHKLRKAKKFCDSFAGYCSCEDFEKWFADV